MYHVSTQGIDECMINGHYYYYNTLNEIHSHWGGGGGGGGWRECKRLIVKHDP